MDWTKIPTDLLVQRIPDNELVAIVKYQSLWALFERQPEDKEALRYMSCKQLAMAKLWLSSIEDNIESDINSVNTKRRSNKNYYRKKQQLSNNSDTLTDSMTDVKEDNMTCAAYNIRLDNIRKESKKEKPAENPPPLPKHEIPAEDKNRKGCRLENSEYWISPDSPQRCPIKFMWEGIDLGVDDEECFAEYARFRDYWLACPGQKGVKLDWLATWRNWLRKSLEFKKGA